MHDKVVPEPIIVETPIADSNVKIASASSPNLALLSQNVKQIKDQ